MQYQHTAAQPRTIRQDMSYADAIRPVRNQMRKFSYGSVLRQLSTYLSHTGGAAEVARAKRMPWVAERLALWALRDRPSMYSGPSMQPADLRKCMDLAWRQMNTAVTWTRPGNPLDLMIRSLLLAQAPHQMSKGTGAFARQIDLIRRISPESKLYRSISNALGLPPMTYLQLAVFVWHLAEERIEDLFAPLYMQSLANAFGKETVGRFLSTIMLPRERVVAEMGTIEEDEWFQPNLLYRTPFTLYQNEWYFWGRPGLQRHLEFAFSDIVARVEDVGVRQAFEGAFEDYVGDSLGRSGLTVLNEGEIKRRFAVVGLCNDFAILEGSVVVLLEAKNKALAHTVTASGTAKTYQSKFRATVVKAEVQLDNVANYVRADAALSQATIHRVVVTYGDLMLGSAQYLFESGEERDRPLVFSIDQLDQLLEVVRAGRCTIGDFFDDYYERQRVPQMRVFSPGQLLQQPPYMSDEHPKHLQDIFDPFFEGIVNLVDTENA